jgi:hypothetical protein
MCENGYKNLDETRKPTPGHFAAASLLAHHTKPRE